MIMVCILLYKMFFNAFYKNNACTAESANISEFVCIEPTMGVCNDAVMLSRGKQNEGSN